MDDRGTRGLWYAVSGAAALAALTFLSPLGEALALSLAARTLAFFLVLVSVVPLLHGFILAARAYTTSRLLAIGAAVAVAGALFAVLARPEELQESNGFLLLLALSLADLFRILAAACLGISLARYVNSVAVILLIVVAAIASDLFSVFAGPTRTLMQEDSPILDVLLLVFPTFGSALGFGLGVSDFIFLALFAATGRFLDLRYTASLLGVCFATFLAVTAGLLLERPLPALPFVAVAFVLVNGDRIVTSLTRKDD